MLNSSPGYDAVLVWAKSYKKQQKTPQTNSEKVNYTGIQNKTRHILIQILKIPVSFNHSHVTTVVVVKTISKKQYVKIK